MQLYRAFCSVCIGLFLVYGLSGCANTNGRLAPVEQLGSSSSSTYSKKQTKSKLAVSDVTSSRTQVSVPVSEAGVASALTPKAASVTLVGRGASDFPGSKRWLWPAKGEVIAGFATANGPSYGANKGPNKGLDIAARPGESVKATAGGKVVYSGRGLKGYGELIILKHDSEFLSAYAHNQKLLVKEGDSVRAGQVIALAGDTDAHRVMLHFEIRKGGTPVDPLNYLPQQQ